MSMAQNSPYALLYWIHPGPLEDHRKMPGFVSGSHTLEFSYPMSRFPSICEVSQPQCDSRQELGNRVGNDTPTLDFPCLGFRLHYRDTSKAQVIRSQIVRCWSWKDGQNGEPEEQSISLFRILASIGELTCQHSKVTISWEITRRSSSSCAVGRFSTRLSLVLSSTLNLRHSRSVICQMAQLIERKSAYVVLAVRKSEECAGNANESTHGVC